MKNSSHKIKVHFIYRQKVKNRNSPETDLRWFSGKLSGHVGIEYEKGKVLDFVPEKSFHWVAQNKNPHSKFCIRTVDEFWHLFGKDRKTTKGATVVIPVSKQQKQTIERIAHYYHKQTPYDYAFIGMRCASATYEILAQAEILKQYSLPKTAIMVFSPGILKNILFRKAEKNGWTIRELHPEIF